MPPEYLRFVADLLAEANDLGAHIALLSREDFIGLPGFEEWLPNITMPCLCFAGGNTWEHSSAQAHIKKMPNTALVSFPGLNHIEAVLSSDLVVPHITKFLAEVGQA